MRGRVGGFGAALLVALLVGSSAACAPEPAEPAPSGGPVRVHNCAPADPLLPGEVVDPCGQHILGAVTARLVRYDHLGAAHNDIATAISSKDGRRYQVSLRTDRLFHDGTPVTAHSFVDAWNAVAYAPNGYRNASAFANVAGFEEVNPRDGSAPTARTMSGLDVVDDRTFWITLSRPEADLPVRLGSIPFTPMPASYFADPHGFAARPVGAGPYQVMELTDDAARLQRFEWYRGATPGQIERIDIAMYADVETAYRELQSGLLDVLTELPQPKITSGQFTEDFPQRHDVRTIGRVTTINFASPTSDASVADPTLRHAFSLAIDREQIAREWYPGLVRAASGWVSPVTPGYLEGGCGGYCVFDPKEARRLLAEAGGYTGQVTLWYNADADHQQWTTAACRSLRHVLDVNCVSRPVLDLATLREDVRDGSMTGMYRSSWTMNFPSPANFLRPLYSTNGRANETGYSNPRFDALLDVASATAEPDLRATRYHRAEVELATDMPTIPMFYHRAAVVWSERVSNVQLGTDGAINLSSLRMPVQPAASAPATSSESAAASAPPSAR